MSNTSLFSPYPEEDHLPVLHRLALAYLMLPVFIYLLGWFHYWFSVPATALLLVGLWRAMTGSWRVTIRPVTIALLLLALGWVMLTCAGGVFDFHNSDWTKHRATFTDLARRSWPVYMPDYFAPYLPDGSERVEGPLRYYLGYYMVPSLIARWLGLATLNYTVPLWTWCGVALVVFLFTRAFSTTRTIAAAAAILVFFSGMDFLRVILFEGWGWLNFTVFFDNGWPKIGLGRDHIEWAGVSVNTQYTANMSALMWVPQHFIPTGILSLSLIQLRRHPRFLAISGIPIAASLFWSPFAAIGLLPLVVVLVLENGMRAFLTWQNALLSIPLAGLLAVYLTSGTSLPGGWLWNNFEWGQLAKWLPIFYLIEFGLLAFLLCLLQPQLCRERFFIASVAALLIIPLYSYGRYNDLCMRASLPPLMVLCWFCTHAIISYWCDPARKNQTEQRQKNRRRRRLRGEKRGSHRYVFAWLVIAVLIAGGVTGFIELTRANNNIGVFRYENQLHSLMIQRGRWFQQQYVAYNYPGAFRALLRDSDAVILSSEKGQHIIRANADVYLDKKRVTYKLSCRTLGTPHFFLHVYPEDVNDLPNHRKEDGFEDFYINFYWLGGQTGDVCILMYPLPEYDIRYIHTGQFKSGGEVVWNDKYYFEEEQGQ